MAKKHEFLFNTTIFHKHFCTTTDTQLVWFQIRLLHRILLIIVCFSVNSPYLHFVVSLAERCVLNILLLLFLVLFTRPRIWNKLGIIKIIVIISNYKLKAAPATGLIFSGENIHRHAVCNCVSTFSRVSPNLRCETFSLTVSSTKKLVSIFVLSRLDCS